MSKNIFKKPVVKGKDKVIDGVCSGLANMMGIDPFWVRLLFFLAIYKFPIIIIYIILSFLMKEYEEENK